MITSRDDLSPNNSSSASSKHSLLVSIRRLTPRTKREHSPEEEQKGGVASYALARAEPERLSTTSRIRHGLQSITHDSTPVHTPVYCPPLAVPTSPPKRRIRTSGTRLPSGYRPIQKAINSSFSVDTNPQLETRSETDSQAYKADTPSTDRSPVRTRITRFLQRNVTVSLPPSSPSSSTPTSSTLSFPSSSSRTTTPSTSHSMNLKQKKVRFSPSISSLEDARKKSRSPYGEKDRVVDVLARFGSPWRKSLEGKINRP